MRSLTTPATALSQLLMAAADRDPSGIAVRDQGASISWAGAAERCGQMSEALRQVGVGRGDRVGVHHRKSADGFLAMHAVVRCGAIAVPLDPTAPIGYLGEVCRLADCRVLLTHSACRQSALQLAQVADLAALIGLDPPDDVARPESVFVSPADLITLDSRSPAAVDSDDPAYLITTSGSTGRPKSICHTHRSALAYVDFKLEAYDFGPEDRIGDIAPNHFDISTLALWVSPAVGATNIVVPEPYQMLPASLSQLAADEAITVWYSVPYLLTQMLQRGSLADRDLSALRWVLFGGEVFPPGVLAELMAEIPGAQFSNVYGPAEVNACAVYHLQGPPQGHEPVPIGAPVAETEIRLVEAGATTAGQPVVDGGQGEIWVKGPTMMTGYWGHTDEQKSLIVDEPDGRWYRTGDLAWCRPDGQVVFAGRVDHQVKVRGHRIELEAIEAVLEDAEDVDYAVATVARADDGSDVVIAGVIGDHAPEPDRLRTRVANRLPAYAVPTTFLPVQSMPTTGSGKLDRRALRTALVDQYLLGGYADV